MTEHTPEITSLQPLSFDDPRRENQRNGALNRILPQDRPVHEWYRFVLSYPPHLVRDYLQKFGLDGGGLVLDPFCGTGTTLVEAKKQGIASVGVEANPMAHFATQVKLDWSPDPSGMVHHAEDVAQATLERLRAEGIYDDPLTYADDRPRTLRTLPPESVELILRGSISPLPLHKTLVLLECLRERLHKGYYRHEILALAKVVVYSLSNLHFGPEVGVGKPKADAAVVPTWLNAVETMAADLRRLTANDLRAEAHLGDSREAWTVLGPLSVDAVITSPPYPNEKDYTRTTRLESVLLGFIRSRSDLRRLKETLVRSNTRNVFKGDDDDRWVSEHRRIQQLADDIESRRVELGKTSGFERLYPKVARLYFGGMAKHLADLRPVLRPGAQLAYVVGDQASYLRVMIRTGQILAEIAESLGYEVMGVDLFRTRLATATREQLREEVVVLRWPGRVRG